MECREVTISRDDGSLSAATVFGDEAMSRAILLLNYGFPGDVRNYDVAEILSNQHFLVIIPHPPGIESSSGNFTFGSAASSFEAWLTHCEGMRKQRKVAVLTYCYSTLWTLDVLRRKPEIVSDLLLLAPVFSWRRIRTTIDSLIEGGFESFISGSIHGVRTGFYGVRAIESDLLKEHSRIEADMDLASILGECKSAKNVSIVWGTEDLLMNVPEIDDSVELFRSLGCRVTATPLPGANHFFALKRRLLVNTISTWAQSL